MRPNKTFEKQLISPVFMIVAAIILMVTAGVTYMENRRFQARELKRIFHETRALKNLLAPLVSQADSRSLSVIMDNAQAASPDLIFFALSDIHGTHLVCNDSCLHGLGGLERAVVRGRDEPVFQALDSDLVKGGKSRFLIFSAHLDRDFSDAAGRIRARAGEKVFDAVWDITYMGRTLGTLRVGFSLRGLTQHLSYLIGGMLGTGFFVLMATLCLIFFSVRKNVASLEAFTRDMSALDEVQGSAVLRQRLSRMEWADTRSDPHEIQQLKQTFLKIGGVFIQNWDQLEAHRENLEKMVAERTAKLSALNWKLSNQIKERRAIEARMLNSQKLEAIGTLAGGIAHEFNNLFMAVTGYASLIEKQAEPDDPAIEKARKIRELIENGSHSVKQLLGFSKGGKYRLGPLNMNEVLRTNLEIFGPTRRDLTLVTRLTDPVWSVEADRSQMEQVVMNLLLNASEAMPGNGQITVESHNVVLEKKALGARKILAGRFVHVSVRDQGRGIKKELIPRIFDPFFTTKPMTEGSGLGLASVYGVVDNHGGFTTVESTEGRGTVFNIFLPAMVDAEDASGPVVSSEAGIRPEMRSEIGPAKPDQDLP